MPTLILQQNKNEQKKDILMMNKSAWSIYLHYITVLRPKGSLEMLKRNTMLCFEVQVANNVLSFHIIMSFA